MKITKKVLFKIESEASYVSIFNGQKLTKKWSKLAIFENLKFAVKQCYQTGHFSTGKYQNSNATFWVTFKQCVRYSSWNSWMDRKQSHVFFDNFEKYELTGRNRVLYPRLHKLPRNYWADIHILNDHQNTLDYLPVRIL